MEVAYANLKRSPKCARLNPRLRPQRRSFRRLVRDYYRKFFSPFSAAVNFLVVFSNSLVDANPAPSCLLRYSPIWGLPGLRRFPQHRAPYAGPLPAGNPALSRMSSKLAKFIYPQRTPRFAEIFAKALNPKVFLASPADRCTHLQFLNRSSCVIRRKTHRLDSFRFLPPRVHAKRSSCHLVRQAWHVLSAKTFIVHKAHAAPPAEDPHNLLWYFRM